MLAAILEMHSGLNHGAGWIQFQPQRKKATGVGLKTQR